MASIVIQTMRVLSGSDQIVDSVMDANSLVNGIVMTFQW